MGDWVFRDSEISIGDSGRNGIRLLIGLDGVCSSMGLRLIWIGVRRIRFRRHWAEALAEGLA